MARVSRRRLESSGLFTSGEPWGGLSLGGHGSLNPAVGVSVLCCWLQHVEPWLSFSLFATKAWDLLERPWDNMLCEKGLGLWHNDELFNPLLAHLPIFHSMRLEWGKPVLCSDVGPWWDVMGRSPAGFYSYGSSSQMASIYWPILCALCEVCMQFKWSLFSASFAFSLPPSPTCTYIPNWPLSCFPFSLAIRGNYAGTILQMYQLDSPKRPLLSETFSHLTPPSISEKSAHLANCAVDVVLRVVFLCDAAAFQLGRNF